MELQGASTIEQQSPLKSLKPVHKTQHKIELRIKHKQKENSRKVKHPTPNSISNQPGLIQPGLMTKEAFSKLHSIY
jgi:hypothetical protein